MAKLTPDIVPLAVQLSQDDWQPLHLFDFSGGMVSDFPDSTIADNQCKDIFNFYANEFNSLQARFQYQPYSAESVNTVLPTAPESFMFARLQGENKLLAARTTTTPNVSVAEWTGSAWTSRLSAALESGYRVDFAKFTVADREDIVICNGKDTPLRWTGAASAATALGLAPPAAGSAAAVDAAGGGITLNGTYSYKLTAFYDSSTTTQYGESGPSSAFTNDGVMAGASESTPKEMQLSGLPAPSGSITKYYVYRSPPDALQGPYRRVGYYTSGTTFVDGTPNGEEGVEIPADAGTPPRLKYPVVANQRLWGVGQNASGELSNKLVCSERNSPDMYLADRAWYLPADIRGIAYFNKSLYVFTAEGTWWLESADPDNELLKISDRGCTSHYSIVDIGNGLVWQGKDNIYWADFNTQSEDGDFAVPIADGIANRFRSIPLASQYKSTAVLYKDLYLISYCAAGSIPNATAVWQTKTLPAVLTGRLPCAGWSRFDWTANAMQVYDGILYTADNTNKYIYKHDTSGLYDYTTYARYAAGTGTAIAAGLTTKRWHFDHAMTDKHFSSLTVVSEGSGCVVTATLAVNKGAYSSALALTLGSQTAPAGNSVFGTAKFAVDDGDDHTGDAGVFAEDTLGLYTDYGRWVGATKGRDAQLALSSSGIGDTTLIGMTLQYKTGPAPF